MPTSTKSKKTLGKKSKETIDLTVPSGETCSIRKPDPVALVKAGLIDSLDSLTGLVKSEHIDRVQEGRGPSAVLTEADLLEAVKDKDKLRAGFDLIDKVCEFVVVDPKLIRPVKRDADGTPVLGEDGKEIDLRDSERDPSLVYTDDVDFQDRVFIMTVAVGGSRDLEAFRQESNKFVGSLAGSQVVQVPSK